MTHVIRSAYDGMRVQVGLDCSKDPGRTKQSMRDETDINFIMAKYLKSGNVDHLAKYQGSYGFSTPISLQEAMNTVFRAEEMFNDLPSDVRKRFQNNPVAFLEFAQDEKNIEEMRRLKLSLPAPAPATPNPPAPTA